MADSLNSFYLVAFSLCVFSFFLLKGQSFKLRAIPSYFVVFLSLESAGFLFEYLLHHPDSPAKSLWLGLLMTSSFLVAPCMFLLARELTEPVRPKVLELPSGHFFILATGLILTFPLLGTMHWGPLFPDPANPMNAAEAKFIHTTMTLCVLAFCLQVPYYLVKCMAIMKTHQSVQSNSTNSHAAQLLMIKMIMLVVVTNWAMNFCRTLDCMFFKEGPLYYSMIEVSITLVMLLTVLRKNLFADHSQIAIEKSEKIAPCESPQPKYSNSALNKDLRRRIASKLETAMCTDFRYRDNNLTLQCLSRVIGEKPHYVSQVINQDLQTNFFELINRYRIEESKRLLLFAPHQNVLNIAMEVGFNSKSTFNAAFKKFTGVTPKAFRRQGQDLQNIEVNA